jgi:Ca2+-binding RTX toxin-like protein
MKRLLRWLGLGKQGSPARSAAPAVRRTVRPELEILEDRRQLSGGIVLCAEGGVNITGTDNIDIVNVSIILNSPSPADDLVLVTMTHEGHTDSAVFPKAAVTRINFIGKLGDDYFKNATSLPCGAFGGGGSDTLLAGSGNDYLWGDNEWTEGASTDNDYIDGGWGDDSLYGGAGNDTLYGGPGADGVLGSGGNDTLFGDQENETMLDGNDIIRGGTGNDVLYGGGGDDELLGMTTSEHYADFYTNPDGDDTLYGGSGKDYIVGGPGNDWIFGDGGDDRLWGGNGDDHVFGGAGNDDMWGGYQTPCLLDDPGNDWLYGDAGADFLHGGGGSDYLDGGDDSQTDYLWGGDGIDTFKQNYEYFFYNGKTFKIAEDAPQDVLPGDVLA